LLSPFAFLKLSHPPCVCCVVCCVCMHTRYACACCVVCVACTPGTLPSYSLLSRVGQNRIYTPYMTVYLVISLPKIPYINCIYGSGQPNSYGYPSHYSVPCNPLALLEHGNLRSAPAPSYFVGSFLIRCWEWFSLPAQFFLLSCLFLMLL